jgi:hypothetical protein
MALYVLVDNKELVFLKGAKSVKQLECWAEIVCKKNDFLILPTAERRPWSVYGIGELAVLYAKATGGSIPPGDYSSAIRSVVDLAKKIDEDPATFETLVKKLGGKEPRIDPRPLWRDGVNPEIEGTKAHAEAKARRDAKAATPDAPRPERGAPSGVPCARPKGGVTGRVWAIADTAAQGGKTGKELRAAIIATCVAEGIDPSTAATQYSKWTRRAP